MFDYSNKLKLMRDMQNLQRIKNVELYAMRLLRAARWIKARISRRLDIPVGCFVLLFAVDCFAQRGTNLKEPVATVGTLALPAPVFRQTVLRWDNPLGASNVVSWGLARNAWTNGVRVINTNAFFVTNNWHYRVTALVAGVESTPALWPSNRVGQLWLVGMSNDMKQRTNLVALTGEFDDVPPGNMQLWGVENRTLRFK
jgi:hypothetical protein